MAISISTLGKQATVTRESPTCMSQDYIGTELGLFARATNWKAYVAGMLRSRILGDVLDVGAGIGSNIPVMMDDQVLSWTALEPDPALAQVITARSRVHVVCGTINDLPRDRLFDTILYMDVLEHIAYDRNEASDAARLLAPGGNLIVLVPAHQFLFSAFDAAIGHHRRYNLRQLRALTPTGCRIEMCRLLDSVGFFASLANRILLRQADPSERQIAVWDRVMVPVSRVLDPITGYNFGKSALIVWHKPSGQAAPSDFIMKSDESVNGTMGR